MVGRLVMFGLLVAGVLVYLAGSALWGLTADAHQDGYRLWIHDRDVERGGTISGHLLRDDGRLGGFHINLIDVAPRYVGAPGDDEATFEIAIPDSFQVGLIYSVDIVVNDDVRFTRRFPIHADPLGVLRRVGRVAFALVAGLFAAWVLAASTRFMFRHHWGERTAAWTLAAPLFVAGHFAFVAPVMAAFGVTSPWAALLLFVGWSMLLLVPGRARLHRGIPRYVVSPALINVDAVDGPFRGAAHRQKIVPADELLDAWTAAGLHARRRGREILIARGRELGVVPLTRAEIFSDEPFRIHATDEALAAAALDVAARVLGPLRATTPAGRELACRQ